VDRAVEAAAQDALALHKQAGVPVVVYRHGKVVTVPAGTLLSAGSAARRRFRTIGRREGHRGVKVADRSFEEAIDSARLEKEPDARAGGP